MKKLFIGTSLTIGLLFFSVAVSIFLQEHPSEEDKSGALGCLVVATPPTLLGCWLIWDLQSQKKRSQAERLLALEAIFLQHLQENQGNITVISFALASKLSLADTKTYLEQKSIQLNSTFRIDEAGGTSYHFEI
jgi:hypothetical protein